MNDGFWTASTGSDWEHALPAGDGRTGALLHGAPGRHLVTLAHERVVLPADPPRRAPDLADDLAHIRWLIASGRAQEAADLGVLRATEQGYPGLQWTDPLVPVATLAVLGPDTAVTGYRREVDLDDDVVSVRWSSAGAPHELTMFVSRADHLVVLQLQGAVDDVRLVCEEPPNEMTSSSGVKGGNADRVGFGNYTEGDDEWLELRFEARWPLPVAGADTVVRVVDRSPTSLTALAAVLPVEQPSTRDARSYWYDVVDGVPHDWAGLLRRHREALHREVAVTRVHLAPVSGRSTEDLAADADDAARDELVGLQHRSGQRLVAASTGTLPPTLQGVWSGTFDPAWSSDYTLNGNVQCGSVAATLSTGNAAQLRALLGMLEGFSDDFRDNARRLFGSEGYVLPSRCSSTHGRCTHFDARHCHELWTAGGAWAALLFLDHTWYTADMEHLRDHAYPFAREVERFYEGFLVEDDADRLEFSPSYSPENRSPTFDSQACRNTAMDRAVLDRLLHGLRRAARLLDVDGDLEARRMDWSSRLPSYRVAPDGTLAEWLDPGVLEQPGHRTASQLLGLWFEPDPELVGPLREPVRRLVQEKLRWRASATEHEEMAYGLVQLGLAAAAVRDAELALACVDRMSRLYFLESLTTTHDVAAIFNVDIAGGFPAVVNAMLVGSTVETLHLLPALPQRWAEGTVGGLHARGGVVVEQLTWTPTAVRAVLRTTSGARRLREGRAITVTCRSGWLVQQPGGVAETSLRIAPEDGERLVLEAAREK